MIDCTMLGTSLSTMQLSQLDIDHPDVHSQFMEEKYSEQIGSCNTFERIQVDQMIEEEVNKDTQTPGGTKGFSLKRGTFCKYYLNAENRSLFLRQLREMRGLASSGLNYPDLHPS